jgi:GNAT superfamily N-acetyltransferase
MPQPQNPEFQIAPATPNDITALLQLIRGLAEYEKLSHEVSATADGLHAALFSPRPVAEAILARLGDAPVGFAVFFHNFSTFVGRPGIYLEDLFVLPEHRGKGIGGWHTPSARPAVLVLHTRMMPLAIFTLQ